MNKQLSFEVMYNAIVNRDSSFEGVFITAVKTTGIFCRPVCTARKPKSENIEFFKTPNEAIKNGYRPCKICKPMEPSDLTPPEIDLLINELNSNPLLRLKDYDLVKRGFQPNQIRRWFKKYHNMTFQAYQRMLRINTAYKKINNGDTVTETAFESGYDSLSGFSESYKTIFNTSPTQAKEKNVINIIKFQTPIGPMYGCATKDGVCLTEFTDRKALETELKDIQRLFNAVILPGDNEHLKQLVKELEEYFEGKRKNFNIHIDAPGTPFQKSVWEILQKIPYGSTRSYKKQAEVLGCPKAIRAVANANGHNRISIVIPCHRVIGENGNLTGYGGGLPRKQWLLDHEAKNK